MLPSVVSAEALMRVSYMRETVAALSELGAAADTVRARCRAEIERIEGASRLALLPVVDDLAVLRAVEEVAGLGAVRAQARHALLQASAGPLLRPMRDAALKLLGATPAGIFRWAPQAWKLVFKNCGVLAWTPTDTGGLVELTQVPPQLQCSTWADATAGAFVGGFELAHEHAGTVDVERDGATFRFRLQWPKQAQPSPG